MRNFLVTHRRQITLPMIAKSAAVLLASPFFLQGLSGCGGETSPDDEPRASAVDDNGGGEGTCGEGKCGADKGAEGVCGTMEGSCGADIPLNSDDGAAETPVYNVILNQDDQLVTDGVVLDATPVNVVFYLGPRAMETALRDGEDQLNEETSEYLNRKPQTNLQITMTCWICTHQPTMVSAITYDRDAKRSDEAYFSIVPQRNMTTMLNDERSGYGSLTFGVIIDGKYVDKRRTGSLR